MDIREEQREAFEDRGWFHVGPVFEPHELEEIRAEYDRLTATPLKLQEADKTPFDYTALMHVQSPLMCRYATDPRLVRIAVATLGVDVRLYWDQAVSKPAGATSDVPWHQDNGYTPVYPEEYATFTVALDATNEENGCLWILPGSHRNGVAEHSPTDMVFFRGYDGDETGVPAPQPEGDVMVFSSLTMHRSGANRSAGPRRSWIIQYCDAATKHGQTERPFDDRLLLSKDGKPLAEPYRDRPLDLSEILQSAMAKASGSQLKFA